MSTMAVAKAPRLDLVALTPEAHVALGGAVMAASPFPFRVGRESRGRMETNITREQRQPGATPNNELYLLETTELINVSREHFQIEWDGRAFNLVDRGSTCGTIVEGKRVGGEGQRGAVTLKDGDVIIVGTGFSPFVFKVRVPPAS